MTDITDLIYKEFTQYCTTDEKYMSRQNLAYDALEALKKTLDKNQIDKLNYFLNLQGINVSKNETLAIDFTLDFIRNIFTAAKN